MSIERYPITDRNAWLAWRKDDLTCSDLGAARGLDTRRSALKVYGEKTGRLMPDAETGPMRRGRWMEPAALFAFQELRPGWRIVPAGIYLRDTEVRLGGTPDAIAEDPDHKHQLVNVQFKTVSKTVYERDWPEPDGVPLPYVLQTLGEGYLLGAARSIIACLVLSEHNADMVFRDVPRHPKAEAEVRKIAADFWANVAAGVMPKADYHRDGDVIAELYPVDATQEAARDLSSSNRLPTLLPRREELLGVLKAANDEKDAIDVEIVEAMAGSRFGELPGWRLERRLIHVKAQAEPKPAYSYPRTFITKVEEEEHA